MARRTRMARACGSTFLALGVLAATPAAVEMAVESVHRWKV
jgi:hypothetical protein